jgi:peptidyl-prolyl cis-trans isomerase D
MLRQLSHSAHGIFAKLLLGILVLSFGVWGIGDIVHQGIGSSNVANVGGSAITAQEYQIAYHEQEESMRQKLGAKFSPELMRMYGLKEVVLEQLIIERLIEKEIQSLGLVVGDDVVAEKIQANSAFKNEEGHFDRQIYFSALKGKNMSEGRYIGDVRNDIAAQLVNNLLINGTVVPEELVQALYKSRNEQRAANLLVIPVSEVKQVAEPTEKEIKDYYDSHGKDFSAPEYRTVSYIVLKQSDLHSDVSVSEDDIKHTYEEHAQDYHKPERRTIQQLMFDNEADANAAGDKLAKGASFAEIANGASVMNKGKTELGATAKQDLPADVADAVFALKDNGYTKPIHTDFGWHIIHVSKIEPEYMPKLEEVHAAIAKDLAEKQSQDVMGKRINDVEDALAGGATLESIAQKFGVKVQTFGPATRDGVSPDGKKLALPALENFISTAFTVNEKDHSQVMQSTENSYFLLSVDNVQPEHVRPLAEVKSQIVAVVAKNKKNAALHSLADDVSEDLHKGKKLADIESARHINVATVSTGTLKRGSKTVDSGMLSGQVLPATLMREMFQVKPGQNTHAYILENGSAVIALPTQVTPAPQLADNSDVLNEIRKDLKESLTKETLHNYLNYLNAKYHVTRNENPASAPTSDDQSDQ